MKTCLILNPRADTAVAKAALEEELQKKPGAIVLETTRPGEAAGLAAEAARQGYELIVAAGGDGTIKKVLNGLAGHFGSVQLGILPLGTANDLARSLKIPTDVATAIKLLRNQPARPIDVIRYAGQVTRYFLNASAGGFSGLVNEALTDEMK